MYIQLCNGSNRSTIIIIISTGATLISYSVIQNTILAVKNLHKEYQHGRPVCFGLKRTNVSSAAGDSKKVAIDDSSFAVDAGEIFGLLGPNGAGKSTTLNTIVGETQPSSGQVGII